MGDGVFEQMQRLVPDRIADTDPELVADLRDVIDSCLDCGLVCIELGDESAGQVPSLASAYERRAASAGVSLATALRRYVAGYAHAWGFIAEEIALEARTEQHKFALLLHLLPITASVLASVQSEVVGAHLGIFKHASQSQEQRRAEIVRKLLAGEAAEPGVIAELGYDFEGWHMGVIATGPDARKAAGRMAACLGRDLLMVSDGAGAVWAWLRGHRRTASVDVECVLRAPPPLAASLAVGEPARGLEGWRLTHRQAEAAMLVARSKRQKYVRCADVSIEAAMLQQHALASLLIDTYLSPLEHSRIGGQAARETLRAYIACERNISSTAHLLGVKSRATVERRLRDIEECLGSPLVTRMADIEIALRLESLDCKDVSESPENLFLGPA